MSSTPDRQASIAELQPVPGNLPDLRRDDLPGCRFVERCTRSSEACRQPLPPLASDAGHAVACWHPLAEAARG
jgi:peptide/nickel transport system ATP-binding protein